MKTKKRRAVDLKKLRPLLAARFPEGEHFIADPAKGAKRVVCLCCGARDSMMMMRNHRPGCGWCAFGAAIDYLRSMFESPKKTAKVGKQKALTARRLQGRAKRRMLHA